MKKIKSYSSVAKRTMKLLSCLLFLLLSLEAFSQEPPPRPLIITTFRNLSFGAFYHGPVGGTVTVNTDASRIATGDVVLLTLGFSVSQTIYRIIGNPGTVVSLLNSPDIFLAGSNGGTLRLHFGSSLPPSPFVTTTTPLLLNVGGTLTVGNSASNPPGNYSGTFNVTFVQE